MTDAPPGRSCLALEGPTAPLALQGPAAPLAMQGPSPLALEGPAAPLALEGPAALLTLTSPTTPLTLTGPRAPTSRTAPPNTANPQGAPADAAAPPAVFVPSYDWQDLSNTATVPPGLDLQLPLDGQPRRARIPPRWQLRVWIDDEHGFWRHDVSRTMTVERLRSAAAEAVSLEPNRVRLLLDGDAMDDDGATVESVDLFGRKRGLSVVLV